MTVRKKTSVKKSAQRTAKKSIKKATKKSSATGRDKTELKDFKLGEKNTEYSMSYAPEVLEAFDNKNPGSDAWVSFICSEFTSLCPKTNQPDFARVFINYIADDKMVESKSLKLYLFSFRNHGDFHEDCIQKICNDLVKLMKPKFIEVIGEFTPRGGISIFPYSSYSNSQKKFKDLKRSRFEQYAPGRFSTHLGRLYGQ